MHLSASFSLFKSIESAKSYSMKQVIVLTGRDKNIPLNTATILSNKYQDSTVDTLVITEQQGTYEQHGKYE